MKTKIAIIGSHSFSGNAYASHILEKQQCLTISRSPSLMTQFDARTKSSFQELRMVWNLNDDSTQIVKALQENGTTTIVNFAAQSMVGQSWQYPQDWYEANVASFAKFVNRIRLETDVTRFIQFTTPEVYGSTEGWIKENFNFSPNTPYAISRAAGDWHLKALFEHFGFPVIFTRAANVYGEHQQLYRIVPKAILGALTGRKLPLQGGGKSIRSFIHVDDVNSALDQIVSSGVIGETYHISTEELVTISDLVQRITARLSVNFSDLIELTPDRPGKDFAYQLDSEKIRTELMWSDKVSLDDGIERTISWVKSNLSALQNMPTEYIHGR
jgi:dTDP-glucose 4,6-dehydratase